MIIFQVWELETGKRVGTINNAHDDNVEVTALCLDKSGYRMATGGFDGEFVISKNRCMIVQISNRIEPQSVSFSITFLCEQGTLMKNYSL